MTAYTSVAAAQQDDLERTTADLIAAYEQGAAALRAAVSGLTADQLRARPVPDRWSMLELVCHVADCEQFFADRMKRTAAMDRPLLIGADGFRYSDAWRYHDHVRLNWDRRHSLFCEPLSLRCYPFCVKIFL